MNRTVRVFLTIAIAVLIASTATAKTPQGLKTRNVVLIVLDGVRWQEVFTGADPTLLNYEHGGVASDLKTLRGDFWRDDLNERRRALFPFLWDAVAKRGQIFGNQIKGCDGGVATDKAFSYPGYNEMLIG